jgi:hypothetical protein
VQLAVDDKDIGSGTLLLGSVRAIGGSVAITIYSSLLQNTLQNDAQSIALGLIELGTPINSIAPLVFNLVNENIGLAAAVPGVTPEILTAARESLKTVWAKGFHKVYYCAGSFGAVAFIAGRFTVEAMKCALTNTTSALISKDVSQNMTDHVAVVLENDKPKVADMEQVGRTEKI